MDFSAPCFPILHHLPEFAQTHVHWVSDAIFCHPHPLLLLPSISAGIRVFSNESALCIRWAKYWRFSASVLPMTIKGWFPLRIDWLDLLAVQGTLKSLLQHRSSKASILWCSVFFTVQLSHPDMTPYNITSRHDIQHEPYTYYLIGLSLFFFFSPK